VTGLERYAAFLGPFTRRQRRALLCPDLADDDYDDLWHFREHWREDLDPLKRMQWADLHTYLPGDLLTKVDRASMAHSLEVRPPLLDHRLVEFALTVDAALLRDVPGNRGKLIVRRLMDGRVPAGLFDRPKRGFNMPIRDWVARDPARIRDALARLARAGIIRRPRSFRFTNEQTWTLLVLDRWLARTGTS
jgi:asparagine synthase (glutamine-hydrolysing)